MGEGGRGEEKGRRFFPSPLFLFRFHFSPFPQKRLILRLRYRLQERAERVTYIRARCRTFDRKPSLTAEKPGLETTKLWESAITTPRNHSRPLNSY